MARQPAIFYPGLVEPRLDAFEETVVVDKWHADPPPPSHVRTPRPRVRAHALIAFVNLPSLYEVPDMATWHADPPRPPHLREPRPRVRDHALYSFINLPSLYEVPDMATWFMPERIPFGGRVYPSPVSRGYLSDIQIFDDLFGDVIAVDRMPMLGVS